MTLYTVRAKMQVITPVHVEADSLEQAQQYFAEGKWDSTLDDPDTTIEDWTLLHITDQAPAEDEEELSDEDEELLAMAAEIEEEEALKKINGALATCEPALLMDMGDAGQIAAGVL